VIPLPAPCPVYGRFDKVDRSFASPEQQAFLREVDGVVAEFRPDVLHGHYFGLALLLRHLAERHRLPFTLRTHSMDVLEEPASKLAALAEATRSPWCRRVLVFPPFRRALLRCGVPRRKAVACWPVLRFAHFHAPQARPASRRVLCCGPAIRKKAHEAFVDLAARMRGSGLTFDLYAEGPALEATAAHNERLGRPVRIDYADPDDMPAVYRAHDWLVYPSDPELNKVGLPVSLVEAQASGLGVCWQELPGRRREQLDFLGGAGHVFRSLDELPEILVRPVSEELRRRGIANARKCDVEAHRHLLIDAWTGERVRGRRRSWSWRPWRATAGLRP
jgi:glycosyltransferase involved in cell wall biosynthesis